MLSKHVEHVCFLKHIPIKPLWKDEFVRVTCWTGEVSRATTRSRRAWAEFSRLWRRELMPFTIFSLNEAGIIRGGWCWWWKRVILTCISVNLFSRLAMQSSWATSSCLNCDHMDSCIWTAIILIAVVPPPKEDIVWPREMRSRRSEILAMSSTRRLILTINSVLWSNNWRWFRRSSVCSITMRFKAVFCCATSSWTVSTASLKACVFWNETAAYGFWVVATCQISWEA